MIINKILALCFVLSAVCFASSSDDQSRVVTQFCRRITVLPPSSISVKQVQTWSKYDLNVWMIWSSKCQDPFLLFYLIENSSGDYAVFYDFTSFDPINGFGRQDKLKMRKAFRDGLDSFSRIFSAQKKYITLTHLSSYLDLLMQLNVFTDPEPDYLGDVLRVHKSSLGYDLDIYFPEVADNGEWIHLSVGKFGSISEGKCSKRPMPRSQAE